MGWPIVRSSADISSVGLAPSRVRVLAAAGAIPAQKVGGVWLLDAAGVVERRSRRAPAGRPLEPRNAWRALLLASGHAISPEPTPAERWRSR